MSDHAATIDLLNGHLDRTPNDQVTRGVLADVVGETDPVAAEALMWLVEFDKYPDFSQDFWWWDNQSLPSPVPDTSRLPLLVYDYVRAAHYGQHAKGRSDYETANFATRRLAEENIIEIYRELGEEQRRGWWVRENSEILVE